MFYIYYCNRAVAYIVGFSKLGYGLSTFYFLSRYYEHHAYILALSLAGFALFLYLFDCHYWDSTYGRMARYFAISILILGCATLTCFISSTFPYGPISAYLVLTPIWLVLVKHTLYSKLEMRTYIPWLSGPLFFNALLFMGIWIYWTFSVGGNSWTENTRLADAKNSGCIPDLEMYPECAATNSTESISIFAKTPVCFDIDPTSLLPPVFGPNCPEYCTKVFDNCSNIYIVWVGPFLVSMGLLFLSFFTSFMKKTGTIEQEALKFAKLWFFLLFSLWIASALHGAGAGVSVTLAALTLSAFVASAILLASGFGSEEKDKFEKVWKDLLEKNRKYLNFAKGLLVFTSTPVFIVYLAVSFLNQSIRNIKLPCSSKKRNTDSLKDIMGEGFVTVEARRLIKEILSWDIVEVLTYAIYCGLVAMTFFVLAPKFTTLFLSILIQQTSSMSIPSVTGILIGVGVILFLLPPVPGAPIYVTLGIVIIPVGRTAWGIPYSIMYAVAVSLLLKLFATFLQQKMIGGLLKGNTSIRQLVGINTKLMRAGKLILMEPGFSLAKVSILCGGPDWPTSVLCGIMDLQLTPVLIGTLPVLLLIVPFVLSGSFLYMSSLEIEKDVPEFPWAGTATTMSTAAAAIVMFGFVLLAAYYVELTMRERQDDVAKLPFDEEVKELDDSTERYNAAYKRVTKWSLVPSWAKYLILVSVGCMILSCYMVQLFQEDAFTPYQLNNDVEQHLNGDWKNLVKPLGTIALLVFVVSLIFFTIFLCWAKVRM